ncbi:MAG: hypothetical protein CMF59_16700 [Leptospiraceae bacterium]|nr:hypothetical protein [Leptospiraceae bacterium]
MRPECAQILLEEFCAAAGLTMAVHIRAGNRMEIAAGPDDSVNDQMGPHEFAALVADYESRVRYIAERIAYAYSGTSLNRNLGALQSFIQRRYGATQEEAENLVWKPARKINRKAG